MSVEGKEVSTIGPADLRAGWSGRDRTFAAWQRVKEGGLGLGQQVFVLYAVIVALVVGSGVAAALVVADLRSVALATVLALLFSAAAVSLGVAAAGSWWISRQLSRQTFGMGEAELARVYTHHYAVLHAIREGLVVIGPDRRVALVNDAALELLGVGPDVEGQPVEDLPVSGDLARILTSGQPVEDEVQLAGERLVVVSQVPVGGKASDQGGGIGDGSLGSVLTMRDHSQVMALADELSATRSLADGLRAQVHESANRLHTLVTLVELGDTEAAVNLATSEVRAKKALTSQLVGRFDEQTLVAVLLGKVAEAERRSVELVITDDSRLVADFPEPVDLVTIVGNFIDNAMDAAMTGKGRPRVEATIREEEDELVVRVRDSGPGFSPEGLARVFEPGWSTKPAKTDRRHGRGIGMAIVHQVVSRRGGTVEVSNAADSRTDVHGAVVVARLPFPAGDI